MNRPPPPPHEGSGQPSASGRVGSGRGGEYDSSSGTRNRGQIAEEESFFVGRYRVVCEIGRGGMANVHLSRIDGPGGFAKWVAIKRIHPHLVENDQLVDMFLDEARMAAGISHPNVAQVFDLGKDNDTYWIAMEYLHGEPVRELLRSAEESGQPVACEVAARIVADAAEGLHAAHELRGKNGVLLNLVHRDVTPHNLFVTYDGYTKVVDFGIAKAAGRLASTNAGELKGKLAYMAPEQIRGNELDRRTDVFALGIVLWEMTTNQRLFRSDTDLDTLEKVQACVVPPPSSIVPGYPRHLEEIVLTALARDKEDRYQTARAFSRALQTFLRRNTFVGFEEVGELMKKTFADRMKRRNDNLAWASEVTSSHQPHQEAETKTDVDPDDEVSTQEDDGSAVTNDFRTDVMEKVVSKSELMEDDDDAATLIARNPSKYLEQIAGDRRGRKSDATQLLPVSERGDHVGPIPAAGRLPRTEPPPAPSRPPLSQRFPASRPPTVPMRALDPGSTRAMGMSDDSSYTPSSRQNLPRPILPGMFANDPSQTAPSSPEALRGGSGSQAAQASVPAAAIGYPSPDPDPRQQVPPTLFDRDRPSTFGAPRIPQNAIETQMSAPRTRKRNALTILVVVLAVLCAVTFVILLAAIGRTYFGL